MINRETNRLRIRNFRGGDWVDLLEVTQKYEKSEFARYDQQWPQTAEARDGSLCKSCHDKLADSANITITHATKTLRHKDQH